MKKNILIAVAGLFVLSGCSTYSLEKLRHTTPKGSAFQNALAKLYMDFSDAEEKDYDWQDSWYFADKGLLAAYGKDVTPEDLNNWNIPVSELHALEIARGNLITALTPEKLKSKPDAAARAQFNFDCWVEQQEENWQIEDIEACRNGFKQALAELGGVRENPSKKIEKPAKKSIEKSIEKTTEKPVEIIAEKPVKKTVDKKPLVSTTSFVVFFEAKQIALTPAGSNVLGDVAKTISSANDDYEVIIIDSSEAKKDNAKLSTERIQSVKKWLVEAGAKDSAIKTDGKATDKSKRKIEIFLND